MMLLAIDPGACTGWAIFESHTLTHAGVCEPAALMPPTNTQVIIERPDAHRGRNQTARAEDIATLLLLVGRYVERCEARSCRHELVRPSQWKGSIDKGIHQVRILSALHEDERSALPDLPKTKRHNMIDAVGLGLWRLGRMGR